MFPPWYNQSLYALHLIAISVFFISSVGCAVLGTWIGSALDDQQVRTPWNATSDDHNNASIPAVLYPDAHGRYWQSCLTAPPMSAGVAYNDILSTLAEDFGASTLDIRLLVHDFGTLIREAVWQCGEKNQDGPARRLSRKGEAADDDGPQ